MSPWEAYVQESLLRNQKVIYGQVYDLLNQAVSLRFQNSIPEISNIKLEIENAKYVLAKKRNYFIVCLGTFSIEQSKNTEAKFKGEFCSFRTEIYMEHFLTCDFPNEVQCKLSEINWMDCPSNSKH